jgi:hypothetical protein
LFAKYLKRDYSEYKVANQASAQRNHQKKRKIHRSLSVARKSKMKKRYERRYVRIGEKVRLNYATLLEEKEYGLALLMESLSKGKRNSTAIHVLKVLVLTTLVEAEERGKSCLIFRMFVSCRD